MKVAVVTPYHNERLETLERCHSSVLQQTHDCTHFMVADGHPRREIASWEGVQHLVLPVSHGDYGNTPRSVGSVSAFSQGFDAVAYLDADNWYAEDHIQSLAASCRQYSVSVAFSSRQIVLSTGELCPFIDKEEEEGRHVDTSCFFITKEAAFLAPIWALMDPQFASVGDRFMLRVIAARIHRAAWTGKKTLFYESRWPRNFEAMGKAPPADAHCLDVARLEQPYNPAVNLARIGFDPLGPQPSPPR